MSAFAVTSDIHANLEALDAVLADIARRGIVSVSCLGDVLGYGPNPLQCLDRALDWQHTLLGNHDMAVMFDPDGFGTNAERAIFWHRAQLESPDEPRTAASADGTFSRSARGRTATASSCSSTVRRATR